MPHPSRVAYRYLLSRSMSRGETVERNDYRIHRFMDSLRLTDLTFAGKRGKKVEEMWVLWWSGNADPKLLDVTENWFEYATRAPSYKAMAAAIATGLAELRSEGVRIESGVNQRRGVDVTPAGFSSIEINADEVYIKAEHDGFRVKDKGDRYNEPTCIARGKKSILQFYRWVKDNEARIKRMNFREVLSAMDAEGIDYHYFCAVD